MSPRRGSSAACLALLVLAAAARPGPVPQRAVERIEAMPRLPQPYAPRDWGRTARDYFALVTDFDRAGDRLPLARRGAGADPMPVVPSYVGGTGGTEALNFLALVAGGALTGFDLRDRGGLDWVALSTNYFDPGAGVCSNNPRGGTGGSFWYDVFANVLFCQVASLHPGDRELEWRMRRLAGRWADVVAALTPAADAAAGPDFDHTGFDVRAMRPRDHDARTEPEAGAGIAWIEYLAWTRFGDPRFLAAADASLRSLERRAPEASPLYEVLLPYGALTAARMNAELGRGYDTAKWLDWCFVPRDRPQARPRWGVIRERFGGHDAHGLAGSSGDSGGYAFAMNSFEWAGTLAPLARYDPRYARALGRWLLNVSNNARLFYPDALPPANQDHRAWSATNDPSSCIAYEGVRREAVRFGRAVRDAGTPRGAVAKGDWGDTLGRDGRCEILEARPAAGGGRLEHLWEAEVPSGTSHSLHVWAWARPALTNGGFRFEHASAPQGPWTAAFAVRSGEEGAARGCALPAAADRLFVRVTRDEPAGAPPSSLHVDCLRVRGQDPATSPHATGDAASHHATALNLCLYGSSHVGLLAAIVGRTSDPRVPRFDLLATDHAHAPAWPSFLLYNPCDAAVEVDVGTGPGRCDVYDAVRREFVARNAAGRARVRLEADAAAVLVAVPPGSVLERAGRTLTAGGRVVAFEPPAD